MLVNSADLEQTAIEEQLDLGIQSNLSLGVTQGKPDNWLLKTGDPLIQVHWHCIWLQGTQKMWLLKAGDPLMEVTT